MLARKARRTFFAHQNRHRSRKVMSPVNQAQTEQNSVACYTVSLQNSGCDSSRTIVASSSALFHRVCYIYACLRLNQITLADLQDLWDILFTLRVRTVNRCLLNFSSALSGFFEKHCTEIFPKLDGYDVDLKRSISVIMT